MKYRGKLYGKIENKYLELKYTSTEVDILESKNKMLIADVNLLEKQLIELKQMVDARNTQISEIMKILDKKLI